MDHEYLFRFLPDALKEIEERTSFATVKHLSAKDIRTIEIPLPPIDEQRRIAAILDQADDLRSKRQQAIERLRSVARSLFNRLISEQRDREQVPFEQVARFQEGPGVRNWQFRDAGIKLINVRNIVDGALDLSNTPRHLDPREVQTRYSHFLLREGNLVIASSGVTWGKIAEVHKEHLPLCLNTSMIRLEPADHNHEKAFIRAFIEFGSFRSQIEKLITGSAQPNFGPSHLRKVLVPRVSYASQKEFAKNISAVHSVSASYQAHLAKLDALSAALQQRAFRGEL